MTEESDGDRFDRDDATTAGSDGTSGSDATPTSDTWTQVAQRHYEPDGDRFAYVVVSAIADARDVAVRDVRSPPLYDVVDATGLETALFAPDGTEPGDSNTGTVVFRYAELRVTVQSDGWVRVDGPADA
ncbi:HalOD1 output domain-containing protein [Halorubellus sp. PRR65]|uniref:HalOD1 output domain-containing protein n=1 Tax=Halorubellus sp. PRR65 TaxID=3098148 RepID=UPI002B260380|nr:HalOD1 output domain-containing protein [Halorubellus sp. PRR65]